MKIHKFIRTESPRYGTTIQTLCGEEVRAAVPVALDAEFQPENSILFCKQCQELAKYVGWIMSGEESKQMESES